MNLNDRLHHILSPYSQIIMRDEILKNNIQEIIDQYSMTFTNNLDLLFLTLEEEVKEYIINNRNEKIDQII